MGKKKGCFFKVEDPKSFSIFLKNRREELKKTLKEGALSLGVSVAYYHVIEKNGRLPSIEKVIKLESFLGLPRELIFMKAGVLDERKTEEYFKYQELSEKIIFTLIKMISSFSDTPNVVTISDIVFLLNFEREQKELSLSSDLVREILKQKKH